MILDALGVQILVGFMLQMNYMINKNTMLHVAMGYEIVLILKKLLRIGKPTYFI